MTNRATIVLAVLVVTVGIVIFAAHGRNASGNRHPFDLPPSVSSIRITNDSGTIELRQTTSGWIVDSLSRPAAPNRVDTLTSHLTGSVSFPVIATSSGPDQFGLGAGTTIDLSGGDETVRVTLGAPAADGRSVYARIGDSRTVVLVPTELVTAATGDAVAFRDPIVLRRPESDLRQVGLFGPSGEIVTVARAAGESAGATSAGTATSDPTAQTAADSILASARRVERIAREWRADGPQADEVMPFQMENMFQELAAVTATAFTTMTGSGAPASADRTPTATLVIDAGTPDSEALHIYAAEGDLHAADLDGDLFFISARRVLRLTMGLVGK
ncbi:MAG: DUF4340 domain-containing protein [Spirochaetales bacterium]|nr:DUF4340 domain-containing protein [Spirochaetales bacterium]